MICEEGSESLCVAAIEVVQEIMDEKSTYHGPL
jgi:hypothetical protein